MKHLCLFKLKSCCGLRSSLPLLLYLVTFVFALLAALFSLVQNTADRAKGVLTETRLSLSDFTPVNALLEGETMISTNEDPQLLYTVPEGQKLESLTLTVSYDRYPYEKCLYYVNRLDEAFGQNKRVWATENSDGSLTFRLPKGVRAIRLDPGSCTDLHVLFRDITLNRQRSVASFFTPDGGSLFWLVAGPGLVAAAITALTDCYFAFKRKKKTCSDDQ